MKLTMTSRRGLALATFAAAVFLAALGIAQPASAQQVLVQGNQRVDSETIRSYISGTASGSLEEARRNLLQTGMFSDVRISRQGSQIVVRVSENRLINRVVFEGNRKVERATLEPELQTKARGSYSPTAVEADVQRILDIYKRTGRGLASVTPRVVDLPNGRVDVVFAINEGDKTGIKEINFVGNRVYSNSRLREQMTSTESNFLSFLKNSDVYDPDRIASDQELIRRYYLKNGYADFRVLATDAQFDANRGGWIVTITLEEGEQYRVGAVNIDSRIADVDPETLRRRLRTAAGQVYNAEAVERSLTDMTTEVARRGYAFAQVRPTGMRDPATRTINIGYVVEEGPRVYVERINVRGNTRTRDHVIRRELDIAEGDAYNKVLLDRGERRLNSLGYFKKVRVTNEPGTAPDRVIVNIDLEDQPTGSFSVAGGYSTVDGIIGEVSVSESNFLGRGQYVRIAGNWGQRTKGVDFSFTEPYFLGYRMAAGFDLFTKYSDNTKYSRYESRVTGGTLRLGLPVSEEFGFTLRYSLFQTDLEIPNTIKQPYNDCAVPIPGYTVLNPLTIPAPTPENPNATIPNPVGGQPLYPNCAYDGETSIVIKEAAGKTLTSLAGVTLGYSTLDNGKNPKNGFYAELKPDIAGLGGDSKYFRIAADGRYYHELIEDVVGIARVQAGHIRGFGSEGLRVTDQFFLGPTLVRGFESAGIGPRDISSGDPNGSAVGGTTYAGASLEVQFPIWGLPRDLGLKGAIFADAGTLFGYRGKKFFDVNGDRLISGFAPGSGGCIVTAALTVIPECVSVLDSHLVRSSVGASILWNSPLGPIRFDYAFALSKEDGVISPVTGLKTGGDRTQAFRFSGGSRF
jgi:outer membrane protein insertion porin family